MISRIAAIGLVLSGCLTAPAWAGLGLFNFGSKVGIDIVQGNDARKFWTAQADVATLFSPRVILEIGGDVGSGNDLAGRKVEVMGLNALIKYTWLNKKGNALAYTGGGLGSSRFRRFFVPVDGYVVEYDPSIHFVMLGMERHVWKRRAKGMLEVRWILGGDEDNSALRVSVGAAFILRKPE